MRCVLHIGTEKTGTTSIQKALEVRKSILSENGAVYPSVLNKGCDPKIACYAMDNDNIDMRKRRFKLLDEKSISRFRKEFREDIFKDIDSRSTNVFIVVNEHLSRLRRISEVERLKSLIAPRFDDVKVVVYLRRQDKLMRSMYSTIVKVGGTRKNVFPKWSEGEDGDFTTFNFKRILELWADVWGKENVNARIFDKDYLLDGDVVKDFLHFSGLKFPHDIVFPRKNEQLSEKAINSLRLLNKYIPRDLRGNLGPIASDVLAGSGAVVTQHEAKEFLSHFQESNSWVAREYFGRDGLFGDIGPDEYPDEVESDRFHVEPEEVAEIFAKLWCKRIQMGRR